MIATHRAPTDTPATTAHLLHALLCASHTLACTLPHSDDRIYAAQRKRLVHMASEAAAVASRMLDAPLPTLP